MKVFDLPPPHLRGGGAVSGENELKVTISSSNIQLTVMPVSGENELKVIFALFLQAALKIVSGENELKEKELESIIEELLAGIRRE